MKIKEHSPLIIQKLVSNRLYLLRLSIGLLLVYLVLKLINSEDLIENLTRFRIRTIIIIVLLYYIGVYLSVLRWQQFIKSKGIVLKDSLLYRYYLIGAFVNNFLPSSVGGDVSKVALFDSKKR